MHETKKMKNHPSMYSIILVIALFGSFVRTSLCINISSTDTISVGLYTAATQPSSTIPNLLSMTQSSSYDSTSLVPSPEVLFTTAGGSSVSSTLSSSRLSTSLQANDISEHTLLLISPTTASMNSTPSLSVAEFTPMMSSLSNSGSARRSREQRTAISATSTLDLKTSTISTTTKVLNISLNSLYNNIKKVVNSTQYIYTSLSGSRIKPTQSTTRSAYTSQHMAAFSTVLSSMTTFETEPTSTIILEGHSASYSRSLSLSYSKGTESSTWEPNAKESIVIASKQITSVLTSKFPDTKDAPQATPTNTLTTTHHSTENLVSSYITTSQEITVTSSSGMTVNTSLVMQTESAPSYTAESILYSSSSVRDLLTTVNRTVTMASDVFHESPASYSTSSYQVQSPVTSVSVTTGKSTTSTGSILMNKATTSLVRLQTVFPSSILSVWENPSTAAIDIIHGTESPIDVTQVHTTFTVPQSSLKNLSTISRSQVNLSFSNVIPESQRSNVVHSLSDYSQGQAITKSSLTWDSLSPYYTGNVIKSSKVPFTSVNAKSATITQSVSSSLTLDSAPLDSILSKSTNLPDDIYSSAVSDTRTLFSDTITITSESSGMVYTPALETSTSSSTSIKNTVASRYTLSLISTFIAHPSLVFSNTITSNAYARLSETVGIVSTTQALLDTNQLASTPVKENSTLSHTIGLMFSSVTDIKAIADSSSPKSDIVTGGSSPINIQSKAYKSTTSPLLSTTGHETISSSVTLGHASSYQDTSTPVIAVRLSSQWSTSSSILDNYVASSSKAQRLTQSSLSQPAGVPSSFTIFTTRNYVSGTYTESVKASFTQHALESSLQTRLSSTQLSDAVSTSSRTVKRSSPLFPLGWLTSTARDSSLILRPTSIKEIYSLSHSTKLTSLSATITTAHSKSALEMSLSIHSVPSYISTMPFSINNTTWSYFTSEKSSSIASFELKSSSDSVGKYFTNSTYLKVPTSSSTANSHSTTKSFLSSVLILHTSSTQSRVSPVSLMSLVRSSISTIVTTNVDFTTVTSNTIMGLSSATPMANTTSINFPTSTVKSVHTFNKELSSSTVLSISTSLVADQYYSHSLSTVNQSVIVGISTSISSRATDYLTPSNLKSEQLASNTFSSSFNSSSTPAVTHSKISTVFFSSALESMVPSRLKAESSSFYLTSTPSVLHSKILGVSTEFLLSAFSSASVTVVSPSLIVETSSVKLPSSIAITKESAAASTRMPSSYAAAATRLSETDFFTYLSSSKTVEPISSADPRTFSGLVTESSSFHVLSTTKINLATSSVTETNGIFSTGTVQMHISPSKQIQLSSIHLFSSVSATRQKTSSLVYKDILSTHPLSTTDTSAPKYTATELSTISSIGSAQQHISSSLISEPSSNHLLSTTNASVPKFTATESSTISLSDTAQQQIVSSIVSGLFSTTDAISLKSTATELSTISSSDTVQPQVLLSTTYASSPKSLTTELDTISSLGTAQPQIVSSLVSEPSSTHSIFTSDVGSIQSAAMELSTISSSGTAQPYIFSSLVSDPFSTYLLSTPDATAARSIVTTNVGSVQLPVTILSTISSSGTAGSQISSNSVSGPSSTHIFATTDAQSTAKDLSTISSSGTAQEHVLSSITSEPSTIHVRSTTDVGSIESTITELSIISTSGTAVPQIWSSAISEISSAHLFTTDVGSLKTTVIDWITISSSGTAGSQISSNPVLGPSSTSPFSTTDVGSVQSSATEFVKTSLEHVLSSVFSDPSTTHLLSSTDVVSFKSTVADFTISASDNAGSQTLPSPVSEPSLFTFVFSTGVGSTKTTVTEVITISSTATAGSQISSSPVSDASSTNLLFRTAVGSIKSTVTESRTISSSGTAQQHILSSLISDPSSINLLTTIDASTIKTTVTGLISISSSSIAGSHILSSPVSDASSTHLFSTADVGSIQSSFTAQSKESPSLLTKLSFTQLLSTIDGSTFDEHPQISPSMETEPSSTQLFSITSVNDITSASSSQIMPSTYSNIEAKPSSSINLYSTAAASYSTENNIIMSSIVLSTTAESKTTSLLPTFTTVAITSTVSEIDQCATQTPCSSNAQCQNNPGSYVCTCNDGFTGDGKDCEDIDECLGNMCLSNKICINNPGNYICECSVGTSEINGVCEDVNVYISSFTITSGNGSTFTPDLNNPESIAFQTLAQTVEAEVDKVYKNSSLADQYVGCLVTNFSAGSIVADYTINLKKNESISPAIVEQVLQNSAQGGSIGILIIDPNSTFVKDLDECSTGKHDCDVHAQCTNTIGGFACKCDVGWQGSGNVCTDINECSNSSANNCTGSPGVACQNTLGSFKCTCKAGYTGNGKTCNVSDSCISGQHNCDTHATCVTTHGLNFECSCNHTLNYFGNGTNCFVGCPSGHCKNGATCIATDDGNFCKCIDGFYGNNCEHTVLTSQDDQQKSDDKTLTIALIAAACVAAVALIIALGALIFLRRRTLVYENKEMQDTVFSYNPDELYGLSNNAHATSPDYLPRDEQSNNQIQNFRLRARPVSIRESRIASSAVDELSKVSKEFSVKYTSGGNAEIQTGKITPSSLETGMDLNGFEYYDSSLAFDDVINSRYSH